MKISRILGINKTQSQLDFLDYDINRDTYKFIDPYYISKQEDTFLKECDEYITSFFNKFLFYLKNGADHKARELFLHLSEVNEICLGMSSGKPMGKGIGEKDILKIVQSIKSSKAYKTGVATSFEDVRIFIPGIDKDKVSDMIANIIKKPLMQYTIEQCKLYGYEMSNDETGYYWNKQEWVRGHGQFIVYQKKKYLLFPRNLVTSSKWFSSAEFFSHYILKFYQKKFLDENSSIVKYSYDENGNIKSKSLSKSDVEAFLKQNNKIDKIWIEKFAIEHPDIYQEFKRTAINKLQGKEDEEGKEILDKEFIEFLVNQLNQIPMGNENATKYHRFISGILELLFYPEILHPKIEQEIHEGRKRIDISFENNASSGFFNLLGTIYNIPCSLILFECKNYSKDIENPELDQMAGRFSARRGKFGIICCRSLDNDELFVKREADTFRDERGLILHLTDADFIEMLYKKRDGLSPEDVLSKKYFEVIKKV